MVYPDAAEILEALEENREYWSSLVKNAPKSPSSSTSDIKEEDEPGSGSLSSCDSQVGQDNYTEDAFAEEIFVVAAAAGDRSSTHATGNSSSSSTSAAAAAAAAAAADRIQFQMTLHEEEEEEDNLEEEKDLETGM